MDNLYLNIPMEPQLAHMLILQNHCIDPFGRTTRYELQIQTRSQTHHAGVKILQVTKVQAVDQVIGLQNCLR
jgi:hypothetical protein